MLKLKRLSKQALAIVCALAILVCGVPMFAFADDATPDATVPAMKNEQVGVVFKNDGAVLDRTYASGASGMDWGYGWGGMLIHGFSGRVDAPDAIDVSSAEYFEFDMYVDHELESGFNVWLSSGTGVNPGRKMQGISAPKAGWNHFCLPLSGFGYNYGDLDFAAVKTLFFEGTISPVGADSARIIVANTAFTKSVPEMKNEYYNPVWSKEGLHITRTYERGNGTVWGAPGVGSWGSFFGNEFEDGGDGVALATVDASKAEYIEFDVYVSADMPAMTMWLSSNISTDSGRARGTLPATKAGWNHIVIPLSSFDAAGGSWGSGPYYSLAALKSYFVETTINPVDPEVSNVTIKFANFAFTKSYPKMANLNADPAWTYEGIVWSRTVANGGSSTPNVGNGPHLYAHLASNYNGGVAIDATGSDYLEFDVYCSTDLQEHSIRLWLNSMNWADCARRAADIPNFKKGWNHVVVSLDSFKTKVETQGTYSISSLRTMFIEAGSLTSVDASVENITIKFANVAFTKLPDMKNTNSVTVWANEGVAWEKNFANGGANDPVHGNGAHVYAHLYQINGGNAINASNADYIEFDVYCSTDLENGGHSLWLSSGAWADSGRRRTSIPGLKAGWNHICLPIDSFAHVGAEWDRVFDKAELRTLFIESSFTATDDSVSEITVKFANVAFTANNYTVEWKNEDGTVLETDAVAPGVVPEYNGTAPVKADDGNVYYTFAGWDKEVVAVTGNTVYTATFTEAYYAAEVDGVKYKNFADAVALGGTVKLLADVTLEERLVITNDTTLDLNGKTLTTFADNSNYDVVIGADVVITGNGTVVTTGTYGIGVQAAGNLTIENGTFTDAGSTDYIIGSWGTVVINGGTFNAWYCALNGFDGTITVNNATVVSDHPAEGEWPYEGIAGNVITVDGIYDINVTDFCVDGFVADVNEDGYYFIRKANYVAEVDGVKYENFADAVALGGTVKLLANVTLTERLVIKNDVTLDLNGYTLTTYADNANYDVVIAANVVITGNGTVVTAGVYGIGVQAKGSLTIENGTFTDAGSTDYIIGSWGTVVINGGTFNAWYCALNGFAGTITVNNATVVSDHPAEGEWPYEGIAGNVITLNGSYDIDVTDFCADGFVAEANSDGIYTIVEFVPPTPDMNNTQPYAVATVDGLFWEKDVKGNYKMPPTGSDNNASWYGHFNAVDTTNAKYLELDLYSNVDTSVVLWVSSGAWADAGRVRTIDGVALTKGWNHICIPFTQFGYNSGTPNRAAIRNIFIETTTPDVEKVTFKMANAAFTTDVEPVPAMNNKFNPVYVDEVTTFIDRNYADGASTMNWATGWGGIMLGGFGGNSSNPNTIDVSKADCVEFDIYSSVDLSNDFRLWLSSGTGSNAGRRCYTVAPLKKGWNHYCISLSSFGSPSGEWNLSALRTIFWEGTINITDKTNTNVGLRMANVAFTKSVPDMENLNVEPAWTYEGVFWSKDFANGGANDPVNGNGAHVYAHLYQMNGGNAIDASNAEFIEFDVYCSADVTEGSHSLWLSSGAWADSGRRRTSISGLKAGWNHICLPIDSFANVGGEWDRKFSKSELRTLFIESSFTAADASIATVTVKFANIAFTKAPSMNNTHAVSVFEKEGVFWTSLSATGNSGIANNAASYFPRVNDGASVDTTKADYIEFDVYTDVAVTNRIKFWLSSNAWAESGRARYAFVTLEKGWNHVVININDYEVTAEWAKAFDRADILGIFLEGTPETAESVALNLQFANVAFTADEAYDMGNIDANEGIDMLDIIALKNAVIDGTYIRNADFNADGNVNAVDFATLKKLLWAQF